ncbi:MAG: glycosyltransferase [Geminicoccaceae bacterium]|nr:glycosyltransferase [Geminicoccaceae bacterium]
MSRPHLLHILPGFGTGGIQTVLCRVLNGLGPAFRHTVLSLTPDLSAAARLGADLDVRLLSAPETGRGLEAMRRRAAHIAELEADLVLTTNWGATDWLIAHLLRPVAPHVHQEHGFGPDEAHGQLARRVWLRRAALRRARGLIVPSETLARIARRDWWLDRKSIHHIANGVDAEELACRAQGPLPVALPEVRPLIVSVAPLRPEKRLDRLIRAFAALRGRPGLVIVGEGGERTSLEHLARSCEVADRVVFAGNQPEPSILLGRADVYALTSDTEQMPAAVLEAMAMGLPVAATDVGDLRHMLPAANAPFLVPRDDEAALAAALGRLLEDETSRRRVGEANRARQAGCYDASTMIEAYGRYWRDLTR